MKTAEMLQETKAENFPKLVHTAEEEPTRCAGILRICGVQLHFAHL